MTRGAGGVTGALLALAVAGSALVWEVASHVPHGGYCFAIYPPTRACNTGLRQQWAGFWILALAIICVVGVTLLLANRFSSRRVAQGAIGAQLLVVVLACLAVRP